MRCLIYMTLNSIDNRIWRHSLNLQPKCVCTLQCTQAHQSLGECTLSLFLSLPLFLWVEQVWGCFFRAVPTCCRCRKHFTTSATATTQAINYDWLIGVAHYRLARVICVSKLRRHWEDRRTSLLLSVARQKHGSDDSCALALVAEN